MQNVKTSFGIVAVAGLADRSRI